MNFDRSLNFELNQSLEYLVFIRAERHSDTVNSLIAHLKKVVSLNEEEEQKIWAKFKQNELRKRTFWVQNSEVCNYLSYVQKGSLRVFSIDEQLMENNVYFATDDWWVVDLKSFIECSPARFDIQALTDCTIYSIHKTNFDELLAEIPQLEKWFRTLLQNALIASENRINYKISFTAEERYIKFIEKYPTLERQISQKHIASYLGITPEHLSKIKSTRVSPKS